MWTPIAGLIAGLLIGILFPIALPAVKAKYLVLAALTAVDFILIGFQSRLKNNFIASFFIIEFFLNTIIAVGIVYIGEIMNTDLFIAVSIVLSARIFYDLSALNQEIFFHNKETESK